MRMTDKHYLALKDRVAQVLPQLAEHIERLRTDPRVTDLRKRVLWDCYHSARMHQLYRVQEWDYNDTHIETAMRRIFREFDIVVTEEPQS